MGITETVFNALWPVVLAGVVIWQQVASVFTDGASRAIALIDPELWSFWIPYFFVFLALEVGLAFLVYVQRRWTWTAVSITIVLNIAKRCPPCGCWPHTNS